MIEIVNTLKGILSVLEDIAEALTPADDSKAAPAGAKEEAEEPKEEEPEIPAETKAESTRKVSAKK